jgi:hypothetical protein
MAEAMKDSSGFLEAQISENLTPAQKEEIIKRRRGDLDIAASNKLFSSGTVGETLLLGGSDTAVKAYQRAMSQNGLSLKESDFLLSNQLSDTSTLTTSDAARLTATQKQQALAGNTS